MSHVVGAGSTEMDMDLPTSAQSSRAVISPLPSQQIASGATYKYSLLWSSGGGYLTGVHQYLSASSAMSAEGTFDFTSPTAVNDPLLALMGSFVNQNQTTSRCFRAMNFTNLLQAGGEIIMGTCPNSTFVAGLTWNQLRNYIDVKAVNMPLAQDVCMPWLPTCNKDNDVQSPTTSVMTDNNHSSLFIAVRYPVGSTAGIDVEIYSNYTDTVLPNYQGIFSAKVQPICQTALDSAQRLLGMTNKAAFDIMNTADVHGAFIKAAASLGKRVLNYAGGKLASFIAAGSGLTASPFKDLRIHQLMHIISSADADFEALLRAFLKERVLPDHMKSLVYELFRYRVQIVAPDGILITHPVHPDYAYQPPQPKNRFERALQIELDEETKCESPPISVSSHNTSFGGLRSKSSGATQR